MDIIEARRIADLVARQRFRGSKNVIGAAFTRLDQSANHGNKEDLKLAKVLWDWAGSQDTKNPLGGDDVPSQWPS